MKHCFNGSFNIYIRGGSRIFRRGGANDGKGEWGVPPPTLSREASAVIDFVPIRRKSMSESRMKAFRGLVSISACLHVQIHAVVSLHAHFSEASLN